MNVMTGDDMVNDKSLANLRPQPREADYDEPKDQSVTIKITATAYAVLKARDPFVAAGHKSLSDFVEQVCRGLLKVS